MKLLTPEELAKFTPAERLALAVDLLKNIVQELQFMTLLLVSPELSPKEESASDSFPAAESPPLDPRD